MTKTDYYKEHEKLLYHMAWKFNKKTGIDVDELISEFNVVFCEAFNEYDPEDDIKFSTFFCKCCINRVYNLLTSMGRMKRKMEVLTDLEIDMLSHDPEDSVIIYDNFVNSPNPVIKSIIDIVSVYKLPKRDFRRWLKGILSDYGYKTTEVSEAFKALRNLYDPA